MLTNRQKTVLHVVPAALGIDEPARRLIQRNVGGFHSSADKTATHEGLAAVMAFYERTAGGCLRGYTRDYWAKADAVKNPTDRLLWRVRRQAAELGITAAQLDAFVAGDHFTRGTFARVEDLPATWLRKLVEALKAIAAPERRRTPA